jgi:phosphoglycolate phosphatase
MARWLVFDLDGTLVDSVPDLAASLNRGLVAGGLAPLSREAVRAMVGDGAKALVERGFGARGVAAGEADLEAFLADYGANAAVETRPYPGVAETLGLLRAAGWTMAVCTNKPVAPARALLAALGLTPFFIAVGGGDSYPVRKPDPAHLLATLADAGGVAGRAVMVGDHHNDILAAHGAGIASVWARWGYGEAVTGADAEAAAFAELPAILEILVGA